MWLYKDKKIENLEDFEQEIFGFVYRIINL
jgi:hypothetical protein